MSILISNVTKNYGAKHALRGMNLTIENDKIYGLLGRNGAGKTTLMKLVAGHDLPSNGQITINGKNPFNNREALKDICYISESNNFKKRLKIKEVLKISSLFYPNWSNETALRLLEVFQLDLKMNTKGLSKGMESALGITIGLASRAKLTIFDEPYIGLDASARYKFYDLILEEFEEYPRTFVLSTHLIDEVSNLFEEVILMRSGELLLHEQTEEMVENSMIVSGNREKVDSFISGKNVLHESTLVGSKTVILYGEKMDLREAKNAGIEAERCNIQQLMVHLTEEQGGKMYV
ncbi:ABC transporter ATP-binding protein [Litchfieldia salsa]|uniref:ABC-2 type transport system ATP-binding protein n=1 Tax=Litchfieldia salsa TaxID=930152 RepID=A0A1H0U392_9BACI|nr:ABC transporter ATP-binding protein [Litchfieldia salsa]SDP60465.1 ABC-2 type transport system ATP-binding protein [Litchfieldia salsa]